VAREACLQRECGSDRVIRREVASLLARYDKSDGNFLGVYSSVGGRMLSHYEVLERIGEGGMALVYKALDTSLNRLVAIKVLPAWAIGHPGFRGRLKEEAKHASGINHPSIITIHNIAEENGVDFVVMEYVPGKTLDALVPRKGLPIRKTIHHALQVADALTAAHAAGILHRDLKPSNYLSAMGRFHHYSWNNSLLIHSQRPDAMRVAGYQTWHKLGRSVRKGEKGIMILAPLVVKQKEDSPPRGKREEEDRSRLIGFHTAYVFDVSQTDGKDLPEFAKTTGDPREFAKKLKGIVERQGISLDYDRTIAPAQGVSYGGKIRLLPELPAAEEFSVLAHELAHEMLHHKKDGPSIPQLVRETQAEAVAFVVCQGIGLETNTAASDYIALYNGDKKTLTESLSVIQETSARILDALLAERGLELPNQKPSHQLATDLQQPPRSPADASVISPPPVSAAPTPDPIDSISWDR
jgi:antirestriction protein ArdC